MNTAPNKDGRPVIVCLCGSTRFYEKFAEAQLDETVAGRIVLSIGSLTASDSELFAGMDPEQRTELKVRLDVLHMHKIRMSDEILVINPGGYIGYSTAREIGYAVSLSKRVRYMYPMVENMVVVEEDGGQ